MVENKLSFRRVKQYINSLCQRYSSTGLLLLLLLLAEFALFLVCSLIILCYPLDAAYGEGILLNQAQLLSRGLPIYKSVHDYPYTVAIYTPLYYVVMAVLFKVAGVSLLVGRALSLLAALAIGAMIYTLVHKNSGQRFIAACAALLFYSFPLVRWETLFRPDMLAVALSLAGIFVFTRGQGDRRLYLAGSLFVASFLTKQTYVTGLLAVTAFLFLTDLRSALKFIGWTSSLTLLALTCFQILSGGWFLFDTVVLNSNALSFQRMGAAFLVIVIFELPFVMIVVAYLGFARRKDDMLFALYLAATAWHLFATAKAGSASNYLLEPQAALSIMVGLALQWLLAKKRLPFTNRPLWNRFAFIGLVYLAIITVFTSGELLVRVANASEARVTLPRLTKIVKSVPGPVLSDDISLLVLAGKPVYFEPFLFSLLAKEGKWDPRPLVARIRAQEYDLLVLGHELSRPLSPYHGIESWHNDLWSEMRAQYQLVHQVGPFYVYEPKGKSYS